MVMPGVPEMLIIGGVAVLLFGVNKIPKLGSAIGEGIKNFKSGVKEGDKSLRNKIEKSIWWPSCFTE